MKFLSFRDAGCLLVTVAFLLAVSDAKFRQKQNVIGNLTTNKNFFPLFMVKSYKSKRKSGILVLY